MSDPLHDALKEAMLAVLLGTTTAPVLSSDVQGNIVQGTVTIESAFASRIQQMAYKGAFDEVILRAISLVDPSAIAQAFEEIFAKHIITGLERSQPSYGQSVGWLQQQAKGIAVEACKLALADDEELWDRLRTIIGAEVERNHVGITVSLTDPEKTK